MSDAVSFFVTVENPWVKRDDGKPTLIMVEVEDEASIGPTVGLALGIEGEQHGVAGLDMEPYISEAQATLHTLEGPDLPIR